ncbi:MAG: HAD family hydrolase [Anaerolineae bacterium]
MRLLIWDFDGTLGYRAGGAWTASLLEVVRREVPEHPATFEQLAPHTQTGFPWQSPDRPHHHLDTPDRWWVALAPTFERAYRGLGLDQDRARALAKLVRGTYLNPARWRRYDDAKAALDEFHAEGWTQAMLSNHVPELTDLLDHLEMLEYFDRIFNSADTGCEKPNPRAFEVVLDAYPEAETVWMIGDSYRADVRGAEDAGIPAILVRRHHPDARYYAQTLDEARSMLRQLMRVA